MTTKQGNPLAALRLTPEEVNQACRKDGLPIGNLVTAQLNKCLREVMPLIKGLLAEDEHVGACPETCQCPAAQARALVSAWEKQGKP